MEDKFEDGMDELADAVDNIGEETGKKMVQEQLDEIVSRTDEHYEAFVAKGYGFDIAGKFALQFHSALLASVFNLNSPTIIAMPPPHLGE